MYNTYVTQYYFNISETKLLIMFSFSLEQQESLRNIRERKIMMLSMETRHNYDSGLLISGQKICKYKYGL